MERFYLRKYVKQDQKSTRCDVLNVTFSRDVHHPSKCYTYEISNNKNLEAVGNCIY